MRLIGRGNNNISIRFHTGAFSKAGRIFVATGAFISVTTLVIGILGVLSVLVLPPAVSWGLIATGVLLTIVTIAAFAIRHAYLKHLLQTFVRQENSDSFSANFRALQAASVSSRQEQLFPIFTHFTSHVRHGQNDPIQLDLLLCLENGQKSIDIFASHSEFQKRSDTVYRERQFAYLEDATTWPINTIPVPRRFDNVPLPSVTWGLNQN